ncbi:unnamed protein product [Paramecium primaurelia]|uniref:WD40-repeat-containing domain n=1 Tax=Paramecium primaurelia TaxID=5886 RepID=A0A8S1NG81_PARPR|nr:unnamed protein product [Paramecium primaurelia]
MSLQLEQRICKVHNLLIIATDIKKGCNQENIHFCCQCLIQKTKEQTIHINEVAQSYLDDIKTDYLQVKTKSFQKTQNILNQLQNFIDELKISLVLICDKITQQIIQESERQSSLLDNLDQTIKSIDVYNFNELFPKLHNEDIENSETLFKSILQSQILQISNHKKIEEFLKCVDSFEIQTYKQEFYQSDQKQQNCDENYIDTPGLKVLCQNHNREIIAFDLDPERAKENRLACIYCIEDSPIKYYSLTYVQKQWNQLQQIKQKKMESLQQKNYENKQVILQQLNIFTQELQQKNNQIIDNLKEHQSIVNNITNLAFQEINEDWKNLQNKKILDILEILSNTQLNDKISFPQEIEILEQEIRLNQNIYNSLQKIKETFMNTLQKISEKISLDQELFSLNAIKLPNKELILKQNEIQLNLQIQEEQRQQQIKQTQTEQISEFQGQLNYIMQQNHAIKQNDNFREIGFTTENDFLIAGYNKTIQIYKFYCGQLEIVQQIDKHEYNISQIYIMNKSKSFISGDLNGKIIFWTLEENEWKSIAELKEHSDYVNQIIMNKDENQMITCSDDKCIKFYTMEQQQWKCVQTIENHQNNVKAISLNSTENVLVSCGIDNIILIIVKDNIEQVWQVKQTIKNEIYGYRICFIKNNNFLFQPQGQQKMWLYQQQNENGEYEKTKEFDVNKINSNCSRWFQMEYKEYNQILLCKNGNCINLFKVQDDCSLMAEQIIQFETQSIYGSMSNDSLYLILWDEKSKQFQIRKQQIE